MRAFRFQLRLDRFATGEPRRTCLRWSHVRHRHRRRPRPDRPPPHPRAHRTRRPARRPRPQPRPRRRPARCGHPAARHRGGHGGRLRDRRSPTATPSSSPPAAAPTARSSARRRVDLEGSLKSIEAAEARSASVASCRSRPWASTPTPATTPSDVWKAYVEAKRDADVALRASDLDWTIIRPGGLTDDPGTGSVTVGETVDRGQIPRADVAAVIAAVLDDDRTHRQAVRGRLRRHPRSPTPSAASDRTRRFPRFSSFPVTERGSRPSFSDRKRT